MLVGRPVSVSHIPELSKALFYQISMNFQNERISKSQEMYLRRYEIISRTTNLRFKIGGV